MSKAKYLKSLENLEKLTGLKLAKSTSQTFAIKEL